MPELGDWSALDRRADERRTPGLLDAILRTEATRVLDVAGDRMPAVSRPDGGRARRLGWRAPRDGEAQIGGSAATGEDGAHVRHVFLGRDADGTAYVAALHPPQPAGATRAGTPLAGAADPPGDWAGLREIGAWLAGLDADAAMTAVGLARWHARQGFCPGCGSATTPVAAGWVRRCVADGTEHFPRTDPAVIVAVVDPADRLLLGRGPTFKEHWVSVLAGFVEPGETLEGAVVREMAEEVGLVVRDVTYVGSQPWPFPASIMLGFRARATEAALRPDPSEIAEVDWYSRERLAAEIGAGRLGIPGRLSIARRLIEDWYGGPLRQRRAPGTVRTDAG